MICHLCPTTSNLYMFGVGVKVCVYDDLTMLEDVITLVCNPCQPVLETQFVQTCHRCKKTERAFLCMGPENKEWLCGPCSHLFEAEMKPLCTDMALYS